VRRNDVTEKRSSSGEINEVTVTRVLGAPRALVFKAWTDPVQVGEWWGPHHFTNKVRKWEARAGGSIDLDMIGPDGTAYPMTGTFTEVTEPSRLTFTSAVPGPDGKPIFEVLTVITLVETGPRTTLTMHATITGRTDAAAQYIAGMEAGWTQTLERLDALVTRIAGAAE
jgi:uncharacterized protein YndB with AHSA1/START domain